jgi:hypothetical protein
MHALKPDPFSFRSLNATAGSVTGPVGQKLPVTSARFPKDMDNYSSDRMERSSDSAYHSRLGNGPIDDLYDYNKQPRRKQLPILPDRPHPYSDQDDYATRANRARLGSAARTGDYYPESGVVDRQPAAAGMGQQGMGQPGMGQQGMGQPGMGQAGMGQPGSATQYSASYNQQNGCSIAPNAGISY